MTHEKAVATAAAERYLLDEMPELERFQFEAHYFDCATCAEEVRLGGMMQDGVATGMIGDTAEEGRQKAEGTGQKAEGTRHQAEGTRQNEERRRWAGGLPWAVAAMLALTVGYQALHVVPGLRDQVLAPQALAPVSLRPASRGADPSMVRPTTGVLSFAVDVNGIAPDTRLTYDLRAADGMSVAAGSAIAPPLGAPLLLLVPATAFPSAGRYTLAVTSEDGDGAGTVEYRFTLSDR